MLQVARRVLSDALEDATNEMNLLARLVIQRAQAQWRELDEHIAWCDERIKQHARDNPQVRAAAQLIGIGPRKHSSGGKNSLGPITRRGDAYLRSLLIQGAKSAVLTAHKRSDPISRWALALRERSG